MEAEQLTFCQHADFDQRAIVPTVDVANCLVPRHSFASPTLSGSRYPVPAWRMAFGNTGWTRGHGLAVRKQLIPALMRSSETAVTGFTCRRRPHSHRVRAGQRAVASWRSGLADASAQYPLGTSASTSRQVTPGSGHAAAFARPGSRVRRAPGETSKRRAGAGRSRATWA